ncbi:tetratricopeptide repeat protein [Helicobacter heilmannii]|uniref:tetratricopeptide repeat protein n=1 Tax=Helicobacter heilmannii TaxID=35817 RepID=UPI002556E156|nr:tetratricopeptide repeat protein [Helicobacter heilmannii]
MLLFGAWGFCCADSLAHNYITNQALELRETDKAQKYLERQSQSAALLPIVDSAIYLQLGNLDLQDDPPSTKQAQIHYKKACNMGSSKGCIAYALLFDGEYRGVPSDFNKSKEYLERAGKMGDPLAYMAMGLLYDNGLGIKIDHFQARHYYSKVAMMEHKPIKDLLKGIANAYNQVGQDAYFKKKDYPTAKKYFERASQMGSAPACANLALMYFQGDGVKKDPFQGKLYAKKAIGLGDPKALWMLGTMYLNGNGVKQDLKSAQNYFEKAGAKGFAKGYYALGVMYLNGNGVKKDTTKAKEYFEKSAQMGDKETKEVLEGL